MPLMVLARMSMMIIVITVMILMLLMTISRATPKIMVVPTMEGLLSFVSKGRYLDVSHQMRAAGIRLVLPKRS